MSRYTRNPGSRLGKFERQRFGGSGVGDLGQLGSLGFMFDMEAPELILDAPPPMTEEEIDALPGPYARQTSAVDTGIDLLKGAVETALGLAPAVLGYLGAKERAEALEDARKRREAEIARAAVNAALGRGGHSAPASSKTGMYFGIGGVALVLVILIVVLLKKKGN